jgi:Ca2+/H+ antiporter
VSRWLLVFVPVAIALEHLAPERSLWVFLASALAIVPLAGWMGRATEELEVRTGEGVGGLLNATFDNAAEHATAVTAALENRMDLSLSIAIGSSVQVALFVAPLLVLLSYAVAPAPMDLAFAGGLVQTVLLSVLILGQVAGDGRSDWLKGVQLLAVYVILGLAFFFAPGPAPAAH